MILKLDDLQAACCKSNLLTSVDWEREGSDKIKYILLGYRVSLSILDC